MIYYESPPGTSLEETDRMLNEVEKSIIKIPEVEAYSRRTGTQMGFFITEPNRGDYLIQLKKNRNKTSNDVIDEIRAKVEATQPALRIDFGQVIGDMLGDLMSSVSPIEVKVFGNNQAELQKTARQVSAIVEKVKGTADVLAGHEINIQPNYVQLAQYGITPNDLQFQMQTALEGNDGDFYHDTNDNTSYFNIDGKWQPTLNEVVVYSKPSFNIDGGMPKMSFPIISNGGNENRLESALKMNSFITSAISLNKFNNKNLST